MTKKTDQDDIQHTDDGEVIGTGNDQRLKMFAQINDENDKLLAAQGDLADVNDDGTTTAFNLDENLTDEEIAARELQRAEAEANQQQDAAGTQDEPAPRHKIKVNGREIELTTEELIARAQKIEAADEYLREASNKLRAAEAAATPSPQLPSHEDVAAAALEERRAMVRAIQMGTEEEALAAIEKLQAGTSPSVNTDDIARVVEERIAFNDAVTKFQSEYKDLMADPMLLNVALQRDKELVAQGDKRSYWERYQEVGNEVRKWRDSLAKTVTTAAEPDKQTRKASAPAIPSGASTKAPAVVDEEDQEESVGEVIAAMAKARGGPQWLRG